MPFVILKSKLRHANVSTSVHIWAHFATVIFVYLCLTLTPCICLPVSGLKSNKLFSIRSPKMWFICFRFRLNIECINMWICTWIVSAIRIVFNLSVAFHVVNVIATEETQLWECFLSRHFAHVKATAGECLLGRANACALAICLNPDSSIVYHVWRHARQHLVVVQVIFFSDFHDTFSQIKKIIINCQLKYNKKYSTMCMYSYKWWRIRWTWCTHSARLRWQQRASTTCTLLWCHRTRNIGRKPSRSGKNERKFRTSRAFCCESRFLGRPTGTRLCWSHTCPACCRICRNTCLESARRQSNKQILSIINKNKNVVRRKTVKLTCYHCFSVLVDNTWIVVGQELYGFQFNCLATRRTHFQRKTFAGNCFGNRFKHLVFS